MPVLVTAASPEVRLDTGSAGTSRPAVTALAQGGYVAVWTGPPGGASGEDIYGQLLNATGQPVGAPFLVNTFVANSQSFPSVVPTASGGFVVVWSSTGQDGSADAVVGQMFTASGAPVGGEFRINQETDQTQTEPAVASLGAAGFVVVWESEGQDGSGRGVYARRYDSAGTAVGPEFRVNTSTNLAQEDADVAALPGGGFVVTWTSSHQAGFAPGIMAQRYAADGSPIGSEAQVYTGEATSNPTPRSGIHSAVAPLSGGGYVVTWTVSYTGLDLQVRAQRYAADGSPAGASFPVSEINDGGGQSDVVGTPDGGFLVTWQASSGPSAIVARKFAADGSPVGPNFDPNVFSSGIEFQPAVTNGADGAVALVWIATHESGAHAYARVLASPGIDTPLTPIVELAVGTGGDDVFLANPGALGAGDQIFGGGGTDVLRLTGAGVLDLRSVARISGVEVIEGSAGDDTIFGTALFDNLFGGAGADVLTGGAAIDWLTGGAGADRYVLTAAADSPRTGADTVFDFEIGSDRLDLTALPAATRITTAQVGATTYVYADTNGDGTQDALVVAYERAVAGGDILVAGSAGVSMFGDAGANTLTGSARADVFAAGNGADTLRGGAGADSFYGQGGADTYLLGAGDSTLGAADVSYDFVSGADVIDVSALTAGGARLTLARFGGSGFLYIDETGDGTNDGLFIGYQALIQASDLIGAGGLTIYGSGQDDALIRGGSAADVVAGFDGADVIVGGAGADQLYGGAGADQFRYEAVGDSTTSAYDLIQDFQVGVDKLDLRALNTSGSSTFTRQSFGGATFVYVDQDGNGTQDFLVIAAGVTLSDADIRWTAGSAPEGADEPAPIVCVAPNETELAWMM